MCQVLVGNLFIIFSLHLLPNLTIIHLSSRLFISNDSFEINLFELWFFTNIGSLYSN